MSRFTKGKIYRKGFTDNVSRVAVENYKPYAKKGHTTNITKHKNFTISDYPEDKEVYRFCISSEVVDRDGDIVIQKGIQYDNYIKNPVVFWGHQWDSIPIGKVIAVAYDETEKKTYADVILGSTGRAKEIETLVKEGIVQATSIGFMIKDWDYDDKLDAFLIKQLELLELSLVGLPANQDAVRDESGEKELEVGEKGVQIETEKDLTEDDINDIAAAVAAALAAQANVNQDPEPVEEPKVEPEAEPNEGPEEGEPKEDEAAEEEIEEPSLEEQLAAMEARILERLQNNNGGENGEGEDPEPEEGNSDEDSGSKDSDEETDDDNAPVIILSE